MNGEIAQVVALTSHANSFLRGNPIAIFFPDNSTCKYCDEIYFVEAINLNSDKWEEGEIIALTPDEWFNYIGSKDSIGIRISRHPQGKDDWENVGFVGQGGIWEMESVRENETSSFWRPKWISSNERGLKNGGWKVIYGRVKESDTLSLKQKSIDSLTKVFLDSLREIYDFAIDIKVEDFYIHNFRKAIQLLEGKSLESELDYIHKDLCPKTICSDEILNILEACQYAYVFGGMGTWNDPYTEVKVDPEEYRRVSKNLFSALMEMIVAATNVTFYT